MTISIITVSYNSEKTIKETFDSIRDQKKDGFILEYLHIDGGSTDSTMSISEKYNDIITARVSKSDSGIYNAMNKGITMATGDVIGFLNSDDVFAEDDVLYCISQKFKQEQGLQVLYGDINYVDLSGSIKRKWRTGHRKSFSSGWHPAHPGFYVRKEVFDIHGCFDEQFRIAADFEFMLRTLEVANLPSIYLSKVVVHMKLGGESNRSFKNICISNAEIKEVFRKHSIKPQLAYTYRRWYKKILQRVL